MSLPADVERLAVRLKLANDAHIDTTTGKLAVAWSTAWDEIAQEWREAVDELVALAEDGQWPTRAQVIRSTRAQKALQAASEALTELSELSGLTITGDLPELVNAAADHHTRLLAAQLPPGSTAPLFGFDPRAVAAMVERTAGQVTALLWPLAPDATAAMKAALIRGVSVGDNPRAVAADMLRRTRTAFNGGLARATNIARTEMIDASREAARQAQNANADVLQGWAWTAKLDARACPACVAMHGRVFPLTEPGPLGHQSCRCARTPVTKTWAQLGFPDVPESRPVAKTGLEWFADQPDKTQRHILGPKRYDAWQAGNYPPEQWAVRRSNEGWRDSYTPSPVGRTA